MDGARPQPDEGPLVRRLTDQGIRDPRVLAAFARVPRHFFVPDDAQAESEADRPLDIGHGQTISQPFIVAAMTEALELEGRERVLEVGTGSGYQTAILCEMLPLPPGPLTLGLTATASNKEPNSARLSAMLPPIEMPSPPPAPESVVPLAVELK